MTELLAFQLATDPLEATAQRHVALDRDPTLSAAMPGYEIGEIIGRGTYGVVYAARHRALGRDVAIKQLWPDLMSSRDARQRFGTEARLMASLDHPHIVRVYDYVEGGVCALVLERMRGGTVQRRLATSSFSPGSACEVALSVLAGLEHAHRRGYVHRDLKPQNLLATEEGLVKIADFGIAEAIGCRQQALRPRLASGAGTPAYMAPEQVDAALGPSSPATDVWAVGAILYEMLSGRRLCAGRADLAGALLERVSAEPPPLREVVDDIPVAVCEIVAKALARTPGDRFQSAAEFAGELAKHYSEKSRGSSTPEASAAATRLARFWF
jgi:serine/threonine-protein kinase